ncbi:gas vesicle protein GvpO [Cereibacter sphaeroides]|uniref:gas vesicle protein GvpO n=1 Tax=Cereibacter sphaeroides TaxID=1063 RepID=UPI003990DEBE
MMDQPKTLAFSAEPGQTALTMLEVIAVARRAFTTMNGGRIDAVANCAQTEGGDWRVVIDVIESAAKIGRNDLLCAYEIRVTPQGRVGGFQRLGRYHREEGAPS